MSTTQDPDGQANIGRDKSDEDDHDLLTFSEAGERLKAEIAAAAEAAKRLRASGDADDVEKADARLSALKAAAKRNTAQPINDANFEKFFGYPGRAKRNLPAPPAAQ